MKKLLLSFVATSMVATVFAGGVENKTNMSTGYLRNPSRNVEAERPEAAFYNIAGTAFLKDGLYIEAGNQFVFKEYANELDTGNSFSGYGVNDYYSNDETTVWLYPNADIVYKKNRWALFLNFGVYAGGGALSYSEGTSATSLMFLNGANSQKASATHYGTDAKAANASATYYTAAAAQCKEGYDKYVAAGLEESDEAKALFEKYQSALGAAQTFSKYAETSQNTSDKYASLATASLAMAKDHSLDVTSITYGGQLGAAFLVTDWLSLSAAFRYVTGTQDMSLKCNDATFVATNGGNTISYDARGFGESCVFGIHVRPPFVDGLDFAVQYQTLSRIDYSVSNVNGNIAEYYNITEDTKFRTDLPAVLNLGVGYRVIDPLYFSASFNYYFNSFAEQNSILSQTDYDDSWELAFGADYRICKFLGFSAGFEYGKQGTTTTSNSTFNPVLDSFVVGGGFEIYPSEQFVVTTSVMYCKYFDTDYSLSGYNTELSKKLTMCSIGLTYKPF